MNQKKTSNLNQKKSKNKPSEATERARAIREYSAGGVVFRTTETGLEFLLIQDLKKRWSIPKGHVESGETLEQTAIREIGEETGLKQLKIHDKLDKVHFFYRREGKLIYMTTFIFLIESTDHDETLVLENSEGIIGVKWFTAEQSMLVMEYKDLKNLLDLAINKINSLEASNAQ